MTIGVGVEGPSDFVFWNKVLRKSFSADVKFDIWNMKSCGRLIHEASRLLNTFRDARYEAGFLLLDYDAVPGPGSPCPAAVMDLFEDVVRTEATRPLPERYFFVCVAIRGLEAWYLADDSAVMSLIPGLEYTAPTDTGSLRGDTLQRFWKQSHGKSFQKIEFARSIGSRFDPGVAAEHSRSFRHFWERLNTKAGHTIKTPDSSQR